MTQTRWLVLAALAAPAAPAAAQVKLNGAGATFPNIIYQDWMLSYNQAHPDVQLNYQSIGSGGASGSSPTAPSISARPMPP